MMVKKIEMKRVTKIVMRIFQRRVKAKVRKKVTNIPKIKSQKRELLIVIKKILKRIKIKKSRKKRNVNSDEESENKDENDKTKEDSDEESEIKDENDKSKDDIEEESEKQSKNDSDNESDDESDKLCKNDDSSLDDKCEEPKKQSKNEKTKEIKDKKSEKKVVSDEESSDSEKIIEKKPRKIIVNSAEESESNEEDTEEKKVKEITIKKDKKCSSSSNESSQSTKGEKKIPDSTLVDNQGEDNEPFKMLLNFINIKLEEIEKDLPIFIDKIQLKSKECMTSVDEVLTEFFKDFDKNILNSLRNGFEGAKSEIIKIHIEWMRIFSKFVGEKVDQIFRERSKKSKRELGLESNEPCIVNNQAPENNIENIPPTETFEAPEQWISKIHTLKELGFDQDDSLLVYLLETNKGDLAKVLDALLDKQ